MKIETIYSLVQPLSHIGESESTTSFLNTINIVNNGKAEEVFALTGNSIRGTLRDCAARYMLNRLGIKLHKKEFNILFSGGNIAGSFTTDIDQAKMYRELVPLVSVFGAGVGNQILQGKITQGFVLPVCKETSKIIPSDPKRIKLELFGLSWKQQTGSINFTRFDDIKNNNLHMYYKDTDKENEKKKNDGSASTQMRYEVEYYAAGGQLYHQIILNTSDDIETGCFFSALKEFSSSPFLGGMAGKGFGMVDASFYSENNRIVEIYNSNFLLAPEYQYKLKKYDAMLEERKKEIIDFLDGGSYEKNY